MSSRSFIVQRSSFFSIDQLERIEEAMLRILEKVGIAVLDEDLLEQLKSCKFQTRDNRVFIDRKRILRFLDAERKSNDDKFSEGPQPMESEDSQIYLYVSPYPQHLHDIETDQIVPFTTEKLIAATKLVDVLSNRGILSSPPGCPADVPPSLQPIMQYWVAATYSRNGRHPVDPKSEESLPYIIEMAEALENPLRHLPVYVFSPLTLGGESLKCVLKFKDRLSAVTVSDMPSLGCTSPIRIGDAFALAAAEVIGSAVLMKELIDLPIYWSVRLCPIDLRSMSMVLGSPEDFLLQLGNAEINAYFHGERWYPAAGNIHTNAKLAGAQACGEKSSLMTAGALLGTRRFGVAGTLSLDEVFSPEQLLYDIEIKDHVQQIIKGIEGECNPELCLEEVIEGVRQRGFAGLETTLNTYGDLYWHPSLFERQFLPQWKEKGAQTIRQKAHATIRELMSQHDYELEPKIQKELDKILACAKANFI